MVDPDDDPVARVPRCEESIREGRRLMAQVRKRQRRIEGGGDEPPKRRKRMARRGRKPKAEASPAGKQKASRTGTCVGCKREKVYLLSTREQLCSKCHKAKYPRKASGGRRKGAKRRGKGKGDDALGAEVEAMRTVGEAFEGLELDARRRVLLWAADRFCPVRVPAVVKVREGEGGEDEAQVQRRA